MGRRSGLGVIHGYQEVTTDQAQRNAAAGTVGLLISFYRMDHGMYKGWNIISHRRMLLKF
jgi:hypothetical protein